MFFMKGPECDAEIAQAGAAPRHALPTRRRPRYSIAGTWHDRRLVVYERLEGQGGRRRAAAAPEIVPGPLREVSSETNPTYKLCGDVLAGRGIRKHGQAVVAGFEAGGRSPPSASPIASMPGSPIRRVRRPRTRR